MTLKIIIRQRIGYLEISKRAASLLLAAMLAACSGVRGSIPDQALDDPGHGPSAAYASVASSPREDSQRDSSRQGTPVGAEETRGDTIAPLMIRGTGRPEGPSKGSIQATAVNGATDEGYVLNFDEVDIRDVLKSVLGDMLGVGYAVDPAVQGSISLHTAKPLPRAKVLPAFEEALRLAGVALVHGTSGYQVVPLSAGAQRGAVGSSGNALQAGYQIRLVPLRYVTAADVQRVLEPLVAPGTVVPASSSHADLITLTGSSADVDRAEQAIAMFDVDWLRHQSFGLFPLRYSNANDVAEDLNNVVGKEETLAGVVRIAPIAHLNAVLVVSKSYSYVERMHSWVKQFDRGREPLKPRLFVYPVQNGKARDLASVLTRILGSSRGGASGSGGMINDAPAAASENAGLSKPFKLASNNPSSNQSEQSSESSGLDKSADGAASAPSNDLRITADDVNNALLISTTPKRYAEVEAALARLDVTPLQVMLEASIAEVDVTDNFKYGVQASFQKGALSVLASASPTSTLAANVGGLSAALLQGNIKATLDLLSTLTQVRVISAPKLLVLNNRTASLQVGDQVPIATSSAVSNVTPDAPTVNTIQMYDTGIILRVTPRVNRNGLVLMDLSQEVSASIPTNTSSLNSPTIQQRRVSTSVAVQDGRTIAIGGLISDNRQVNRTGLPSLKDVPGLGALFGTTSDGINRTELIVMITPHVIRNAQSADAVTDEIRAKLPMLQGTHAAGRRNTK